MQANRRSFLKLLGVAPVAAVAAVVAKSEVTHLAQCVEVPQQLPGQDYAAWHSGKIVGYLSDKDIENANKRFRLNGLEFAGWAKARLGIELKDKTELYVALVTNTYSGGHYLCATGPTGYQG